MLTSEASEVSNSVGSACFRTQSLRELIVLNPDSLVPPLKHGPILFFLATLVNTAVRMRLPDDQWNECVIDLDGIDARGRLHFSRNGRPFVTIPLRILRHAEASAVSRCN